MQFEEEKAMTPDAPTPVDEVPVIAVTPKKRCLRFCLYHAFLSFTFLILVVILIPRWFPPVGDWLFPYVKKNQIEKWQSQLSSLTLVLKDLKPQEMEAFNERLQSLEEKLQRTQVVLEASTERPHSLGEMLQKGQSPAESPQTNAFGERSYFMEVLLLCQEIEGRLLAEQDYQAPLALLAALLKTPEEHAWLHLLSSHTSAAKEPTETPTEGITANWPWWLKPVQNFFTIQPLTDKIPVGYVDKRLALQKLKDVAIANYQKASLAAAGQESAS
jgi:hypothetical protein